MFEPVKAHNTRKLTSIILPKTLSMLNVTLKPKPVHNIKRKLGYVGVVPRWYIRPKTRKMNIYYVLSLLI